MPYKHIEKKIPSELDRRIKLSNQDKEIIRSRYKLGEAIRAIARDYPQCSRRLIQFVIFSERLEHARELLKKWQEEHGNVVKRYGKEKWAEVMREHRRYKESIKNKLL